MCGACSTACATFLRRCKIRPVAKGCEDRELLSLADRHALDACTTLYPPISRAGCTWVTRDRDFVRIASSRTDQTQVLLNENLRTNAADCCWRACRIRVASAPIARCAMPLLPPHLRPCDGRWIPARQRAAVPAPSGTRSLERGLACVFSARPCWPLHISVSTGRLPY